MIKTITDYQSLTLSMIRVPKFQQTVEDNIHMLYKNESTKRKKHVPGKKNFFQGVWAFFKFQGGIDQEVCVCGGRGVDQHSFLGGIALCRGGRISFFQGAGLRGVLPSMVTLLLFHLHFHMSLTSCQTKFSQLQKMLLVSHKQFFAKTRLCIYA